MKISIQNLEAVRNLLCQADAALTQATKEARESEEERLQLDSQLRSLQAGFDRLASAFAVDGGLEEDQLTGLPKVIKDALGWVAPPEPAAA
jgi:hypothetical protein